MHRPRISLQYAIAAAALLAIPKELLLAGKALVPAKAARMIRSQIRRSRSQRYNGHAQRGENAIQDMIVSDAIAKRARRGMRLVHEGR